MLRSPWPQIVRQQKCWRFAKRHGLEGASAKRADSVYQPGQRTGLWSKYRINIGQEFGGGGYISSHLGVDSIVVGFYRGKSLIHSARVRAGFVPGTRREVSKAINHLRIAGCPFVNLPEAESGRWGQGLTAEKMKECIWNFASLSQREQQVMDLAVTGMLNKQAAAELGISENYG